MYSGVINDTADTADSVSCNGKIWSQQSAQIVRGAAEHTFKPLQEMKNFYLPPNNRFATLRIIRVFLSLHRNLVAYGSAL